MKSNSVLAAGFLPGDALAMLQEKYTVHDWYNDRDRDAMLETLGPDIRCVVGTSHAVMDNTLFDRLPALQQVSIYGMGYERIDVQVLSSRNIVLTNTPAVMVEDVADLGMSLVLATMRRVVAADRFVRAGLCADSQMPFAHSVRGKVLGIAGLGGIGREIARRAEVFGMHVIYHNRRQRNDVTYGYRRSLQALAEDSDVLLLCTPGGEETRHMVDADILERLGQQGTLINIGRGSVVDEKALVKALQEGVIAAAGLDVFEDLACPDEALFSMENVVLSPHRGSATWESRGAMARLFVENVEAFFSGRPLPTPVVFQQA